MTSRRCFCEGHVLLSTVVLYHTSVGFTTEVLLPIPTCGMAGMGETSQQKQYVSSESIGEKYGKIDKITLRLHNRQSVPSEPCAPVVPCCPGRRDGGMAYAGDHAAGRSGIAKQPRRTSRRPPYAILNNGLPSRLGLRPQLTWLITQQRWSLLLDSFTGCCPLGRVGDAALSVSANRLIPGPWPLRCRPCAGAKRYPQQDITVVIAYDVGYSTICVDSTRVWPILCSA
jgi:hypothetical protein